MVGAPWRLHWPVGAPLPHGQCPMAVALKQNRQVTGLGVAERPDGSRVLLMDYPTRYARLTAVSLQTDHFYDETPD
jgi:hypothetical protein